MPCNFLFPRENHLRKKENFETLYRHGHKIEGFFYSFHFLPSDQNRLGISISSRLGGAVFRNRQKRLIREAYRHVLPSLQTRVDLCVTMKNAPGRLSGRELARYFSWLCQFSYSQEN